MKLKNLLFTALILIGLTTAVSASDLWINRNAGSATQFGTTGTCSIDASGNATFNTVSVATSESYYSTLAVTETQAGGIPEASKVNFTVTQAGTYFITAQISGTCGADTNFSLFIKTGSSTYTSATYRAHALTGSAAALPTSASGSTICYLSAGDTVHLGVAIANATGNEVLYGDDADATYFGGTAIMAVRLSR